MLTEFGPPMWQAKADIVCFACQILLEYGTISLSIDLFFGTVWGDKEKLAPLFIDINQMRIIYDNSLDKGIATLSWKLNT